MSEARKDHRCGGSHCCACILERERDEARDTAIWLRDWLLKELEKRNTHDTHHIFRKQGEMPWFRTKDFSEMLENSRKWDEVEEEMMPSLVAMFKVKVKVNDQQD
jgi:hypothetical protein